MARTPLLLAIQDLGRGRNGKLQLQFANRLWSGTGPWPGISTGETYADTGYQNTWEVSRGQAGASGILVDYTGGNTTLSKSTSIAWGTIGGPPGVAKDAAKFLTQIEPVFPSLTATWNGKATSSLPHLDANFQCSYSYWRVGQYTSEGIRAGNQVLTALGKK